LVVDSAGTTQVEEKIIVSASETHLRVPIQEGYKDLSLELAGSPLNFDVVEGEDGSEVSAFVDAAGVRSVEVILKYSSRYFTSKSGGVWTLSFPAEIDPFRTIVSVKLPFNTTIVEWGPKTRFTPTSDGLYVYPETEEYNLLLTYTVGEDSSQASPNLLLVYASVIIVVLVFLVLYYRKRTKSSESSGDVLLSPPPVEVVDEGPGTIEFSEAASVDEHDEDAAGASMKESVYQMLEDNERKIVDALLSEGEDITQAQLCRETGIPKATMSDLMRRLEKRNVIERERQGRRNWVKLKKWVFQ